jgi:hydrogenase maturation protease
VSGQALVIGIGNVLRGDDGVGWRLAEEVEAEAEREEDGEGERQGKVRCLQQLTPELAEELARVERVLFIDAWLAPAGAAPCLQPVTPGGSKAIDSHRLEPAHLLALAQELYGAAPRAAALLVPAFAFPHGEGLSADLQRSLPAARRLLRRWLAPCHA